MAFDMSDYVTVPERLAAFFTKYPEGSFQQVDLRIIEVDGATFLAYTAAAYRTPDDQRPAHGTAWEPVPGLTSYTKNSELQNAETSAWGRAIIAVGAADAKKGIASREEVEARKSEADLPVPGYRSSLIDSMNKLKPAEAKLVRAYCKEQGLPVNPAYADSEEADLIGDFIQNGLPKVDA